MLKRLCKSFCAILLCFLCSCGVSENSTATPSQLTKISAKTAKEMMDAADDYILLDVRTQEEFQEQHIANAILIPDTEILSRAETELPNKEQPIFIYCRTGRRSALAAQELADLGFTQVYDFGGIVDWSYETIQSEKENEES